MIREQSISNKNNDTSQSQAAPPPGENAANAPSQPGPMGPPEHQSSRSQNQVFKSGHVFISSKGIGWTSWKKRWFILTRTSLVFFRSDPSAAPQRGGETNLTLGGIDLNNSASVEVKADKKLLTVFFPDGRDGRAFTLKAETLEDLYEWKTALENAVAQAPSASAGGQNGVINPEHNEAPQEPAEPPQNDKLPGKSMVLGRPVLLALEDIDGSPSFLEKALRFIETHGFRVEGILRQAADVDHVYRRVHDYEHGKTDFSPDEDAHVIGDCIKYILRELPSSPVPATCCTALLEAFRSERNNRLNNMRTAILETFPEPNRRLLQRILLMMQHVAANRAQNRMSVSAVAACMSPLLLRPLLAGECELEKTHMDVAGDGSYQLLQAAAAANHAQAIVITLLEEYDNIFGEGPISPELFSDSDESYSGSEEGSDDDDSYDDDDSDEDALGTDGDSEHSGSETCSGNGDHGGSDSHDDKKSEGSSSSRSSSKSHKRGHRHKAKHRSPSKTPHKHGSMKRARSSKKEKDAKSVAEDDNKKSQKREISGEASKNVSTESDNEKEVERLEKTKNELQNEIAEKAKHNATLQENLGKRKKDLHERRVALEKDVARLQDELQKEKDIGAALEFGDLSRLPTGFDEQTMAKLREIAVAKEVNNNLKQKVENLGAQIHQEREKNAAVIHEGGIRRQETPGRGALLQYNKDNELSSSFNKNQNQNQQNHTSRSGTFNAGSQRGNSAADASALKSFSSKKSGKGEGGNPSTTLSKLTNRLNFLKERRNQIASELENLDKEKGSSHQFVQNSGRGKSLEEKSQGKDGSHFQNREEISRQFSSYTSLKGDSKDNTNKRSSISRSDTSTTPSSDKGRKSDNQPNRQQDGNHSNTSSSKVNR